MDPNYEALMQNLSNDEEQTEEEVILEVNCEEENFVQTGRRRKHRIHWDKVNNTQQSIQHIPQFDENLALNNTTVESPLAYFKQFISDDLLDKMCYQSNLYALQKNPTNHLSLTRYELEQWLGISMQMSITKIANTHLHWSSYTLNENISEIMSRKRWENIKSNLYLVDNTTLDSNDKLSKVKLLVDYLRQEFKKIPMEEYLSIDEQMVPFKGASSLKQYIPKKPHKWGYKLFVLADHKGMVYDFFPYSEKIPPVIALVFQT